MPGSMADDWKVGPNSQQWSRHPVDVLSKIGMTVYQSRALVYCLLCEPGAWSQHLMLVGVHHRKEEDDSSHATAAVHGVAAHHRAHSASVRVTLPL